MTTGAAIVCDDVIPCTADSCNEATDACDFVPDDSYCDDGTYCDGAEYCHPTLNCELGPPIDCDDAIACTTDACDEANDTCLHVPDHANCDDSAYCDGVETCDPIQDCQPGADRCPDQSCDESTDMCFLSDLELTLTNGVEEVVAEGTATYSLVVTNDGTTTVDVTLSDTFPAELVTCRWQSVAAGGASGNTAGGGASLGDTLQLRRSGLARCHGHE